MIEIQGVLGHNHGDHSGAMPYAYDAGVDVYMCDRVGPAGGDWSIQVYNKKYTSANAVIDSEKTGTYTGDKVHLIDEGYVFDLATICSGTRIRNGVKFQSALIPPSIIRSVTSCAFSTGTVITPIVAPYSFCLAGKSSI